MSLIKRLVVKSWGQFPNEHPADKPNFILLLCTCIVVWNFPNGFCKLNLIKLYDVCVCVCVRCMCQVVDKERMKTSLHTLEKAHINNPGSAGLVAGWAITVLWTGNNKTYEYNSLLISHSILLKHITSSPWHFMHSPLPVACEKVSNFCLFFVQSSRTTLLWLFTITVLKPNGNRWRSHVCGCKQNGWLVGWPAALVSCCLSSLWLFHSI